MMEKKAERGTRTGFTTGACAAAAARAAVLGLVTGRVPEEIDSLLPNGARVRFAVHDGRCDERTAHAMVVKFAGDDPDCTDGAHLTVDLRVLPGQAGTVTFVAGDGVGTVTMPGLGLEVGGPRSTPSRAGTSRTTCAKRRPTCWRGTASKSPSACRTGR
jgi:cobalt-precorrin-5B (C1)-methyltransferase